MMSVSESNAWGRVWLRSTSVSYFAFKIRYLESRLGLSVETTRKRKAQNDDQANAKKTKTVDADKKCTIM